MQDATDGSENEERSRSRRALVHPESEQSGLQYRFNVLDGHLEADTHPVYDSL